jgi:Ca2+-binding EF-hand superfamily protein
LLNLNVTLLNIRKVFNTKGELCNSILYSIDAGVVEFDDFLKIVLEHRSTENAPNEILAAFQHYDTQRLGYIDSKQLRYILTNTGEKLTDRDGKKKSLITSFFFFFFP